MKVRAIAACGLMTAVTVLLSQISLPIPISPVPISFGYAAVFLCGALLTPGQAFLSQLAYLAIGAIGLPVFANFQGGMGRLLGPTGGFLFAYPVMAATIAMFAGNWSRGKGMAARIAIHAVGMASASVIGYALGTAWFCIQQQVGVMPALAACVLPFIPADLVKIGLCAAAAPLLRARLNRAGLLLPGRNA